MTLNLAELRRLEAEATPGEWEHWGEGGYVTIGKEADDGSVRLMDLFGRSEAEDIANAALIVAMRNALPELLKALEALKRLSTYEAFTNEGWGYSHPEITARVECARAALPPHGGVDVG